MTIEDYTTYIEVEEQDRITVSATQIIHEIYESETNFVYKDMGSGYFTDFTHILDAKVIKDDNGVLVWPWALSDTGNKDRKWQVDNNSTFIALKPIVDASGNIDIAIEECPGDTTINQHKIESALSDNTYYYYKIVKSGTSLVCGVYSTDLLRDAGNGTDGDVTNMSLTLESDYSFQYVYPSWLRDRGVVVHATLYSENLDFNPLAVAAAPSGSVVPLLTGIGILAKRRTPRINLPKFTPRIVA